MGIRVSRRDNNGVDVAESFLQSDFWASFKAEWGWTPLRLALSLEGGAPGSPLLLLIRRLPAGYCFAYIPHGPETRVRESDQAIFLAELSESCRPFLPARCVFIRYDPPWYAAETKQDGLFPVEGPARPRLGPPLRKAAADVQVPDTVLVDLHRSEESILAAMKSKWRYNIRLAEKRGVTVEDAGGDAVPEFYDLYRETSRRDRIALHPESYYSRLFSIAAERRSAGYHGTPDLRLWIARFEGRALAAIITLFRGEEAVYLYGASCDHRRDLMPAYALQWAAMSAAKASGCARYDLFGIPPFDDPGHPMAGLFRFKTGFGGAILHRPGSWDYPLRVAEYEFFKMAETARTWWFKDFRKRFRR